MNTDVKNNAVLDEAYEGIIKDLVKGYQKKKTFKKRLASGELDLNPEEVKKNLEKATTKSGEYKASLAPIEAAIKKARKTLDDKLKTLKKLQDSEGNKTNITKEYNRIVGLINTAKKFCTKCETIVDQFDTNISESKKQSYYSELLDFNSDFQSYLKPINTALDKLKGDLDTLSKNKIKSQKYKNEVEDMDDLADSTRKHSKASSRLKSAQSDAEVDDIKMDSITTARKITAKNEGKDMIKAAKAGTISDIDDKIDDLEEKQAKREKKHDAVMKELQTDLRDAESEDEKKAIREQMRDEKASYSEYQKMIDARLDEAEKERAAAVEKVKKEAKTDKEKKTGTESFTEGSDDEAALEAVDREETSKKYEESAAAIERGKKIFDREAERSAKIKEIKDVVDEQKKRAKDHLDNYLKKADEAIEKNKEDEELAMKFNKNLETKKKMQTKKYNELIEKLDEVYINAVSLKFEDTKKIKTMVDAFIKKLESIDAYLHMAICKFADNPNKYNRNLNKKSATEGLGSKDDDMKSPIYEGSKAIETLIACYDKPTVEPEKLAREISNLRMKFLENLDNEENEIKCWERKTNEVDDRNRLKAQKNVIEENRVHVCDACEKVKTADKDGKFDDSKKNTFISAIRRVCNSLTDVESVLRRIANNFRGVELGAASYTETEDDNIEVLESLIDEIDASYETAFEANLKLLDKLIEGVRSIAKDIKSSVSEIDNIDVKDNAVDQNKEDDDLYNIKRQIESALSKIDEYNERAIKLIQNYTKSEKSDKLEADLQKCLKYRDKIKEEIDAISTLRDDSVDFHERYAQLKGKLKWAEKAVAFTEKTFKSIRDYWAESTYDAKMSAAVASYCLSCIDDTSITLESLIENPAYMTTILLSEFDTLKNEEYVDLAVEGFVENVKNLGKKIQKTLKNVTSGIDTLKDEKKKLSEFEEKKLTEEKEKREIDKIVNAIIYHSRVFARLTLQYEEYINPATDSDKYKRFDEMNLSATAINKNNEKEYEELVNSYKEYKKKYGDIFGSRTTITLSELKKNLDELLALYNKYSNILIKLSENNYSLANDMKDTSKAKLATASYCKTCLESYGITTDDIDVSECGELMCEIIAHESKEIADELLLDEAYEAVNNIKEKFEDAAFKFRAKAENFKVNLKLLKMSMGKKIDINKLKTKADYRLAVATCITIYGKYNDIMNNFYKVLTDYVNNHYLTDKELKFFIDSYGLARWSSGNTNNGYDIEELYVIYENEEYDESNHREIIKWLVKAQDNVYEMAKCFDKLTKEVEERIREKKKLQKFNTAKESLAGYCKEIIDRNRNENLSKMDSFSVDYYNYKYADEITMEELMNSPKLMNLVICTESYIMTDLYNNLQDAMESYIDPYEAAIEGFVDTMKTLATDLGVKAATFVKEKAIEIKNDPLGFFLNILRNFISWCEALLDKVKGQAVSKNVSTMIVKLCNTFIKDIEGFANGDHITKDSVKKFENIVDRIHKEYEKIADEIRKDKEAGNVLTDEEVLSVGEATKYHKCIRVFIGKIKTIEKKLGDVNYGATLYQDKLSPEAVEKYFILYVQNVQAALIMMTSLMRSAYVSNKDRVFVGVPTFTEVDRSQLA